ncbi:MAG: hypothetical protein SFT92_05460 [Rickettsiales bacterium]|nr:hypothetical protein [Rickettsiales bacterium]
MADIRLISITPPQSVSQPQQVQGATTQGSPPAPERLSTGTILAGFIVNRDGSGNPILRSERGDVVFASPFFLKIGSEVVIRIENRAGHNAAHILSINGLPPEVATQQSAFSDSADVIVSGGKTAVPANTTTQQNSNAPVLLSDTVQTLDSEGVPPAITLRGSVVAQPTAGSNTLPLPAAGSPVFSPLPNGTSVSLTLLSVANAPSQALELLAGNLPAPSYNNAGFNQTNVQLYSAYTRNSILPNEGTHASTTAPATAPTSPTAPAAIPGAAPSVPISEESILAPTTAPTTPATTPTTPAAPAAATLPAPAASVPVVPGTSVVPASVLAYEPTGEMLLQTPLGFVRLESDLKLPIGSQLGLRVDTVTAATSNPLAAATAATQTPASLPELARQWPSLEQLLAALEPRLSSGSFELINIAALPALLSGALPTNAPTSTQTPPPQAFSVGLLFFLTALKGSDLSSWLGTSNIEWAEEQGHGALIKKAAAEFSTLARQYEAGPSQPWQSLFFPVAVEGHVQQVRLFVKRDTKSNKPGQEAPEDDETRFVLELNLSQMGDMQLDGFVHKQRAKTQFDLYIRSHTQLTSAVQQDIMRIYNDMGELTGYRGNLVFQATKEFPVNPLEELFAHTHSNVVA